jgi:hypothetical protein
MKRILLLSANPNNTQNLRLDQEVRDIKEALKLGGNHHEFKLESEFAVRPKDLRRAILDHEPNIIHFSGHGTGEDGILLEDETGQAKLIGSEALSGLFQLFSHHLECVILNACYSEFQAKVICQHINYVIGMNAEITDAAALKFSEGFYDALARNKDYEFAYNLGCKSLPLEGLQESGIPKFLKNRSLLSKTINLGINGSVKREYDNPPDKILDWTEHYDFDAQPRKLASPEIWQRDLLPDLEQARDELAQGRRGLTLDLRGMIPLSGAFAIGTVFQETRGFTLQVEQSTGSSSSLWRSDANPSTLKFQVAKKEGNAGKNLGIALVTSRKVWPSVQKLYQHPDYKLDTMLYLEPDVDSEVSNHLIKTASDAIALVYSAQALIDHYRQHYDADRLHLIFACPMGIAALLGHRLRAVGEVVTYEFTKSAEEPYVPSVILNL